MTRNKIILKSLGITALYFIAANIYFFGGFSSTVDDNSFREVFEMIFTLPALIIFGIGFTSGSSWAYFAAFIVFLILWSIILVVTYTYYSLKKDIQKGKPTA